MPRLFVGNFDFEHHLARRSSHVAASWQRLNEQLACCWLAVAEDSDFLWLPAAVEAGFLQTAAAQGLPAVIPVGSQREVPPDAELSPWGWSGDVDRWAAQRRIHSVAPDLDAVRRVNSRRFSFALEQEWNVGLAGAAAIASLDELAAALHRLPPGVDRWVLKAEFSMSARERLLGRGRAPTEATLGWARRRLAADGVLFLEPWIERLGEAGLQFTILNDPDAPPVFEGLAPLLADQNGGYAGSRFTLSAGEHQLWQPAIEVAQRAAARIQQAGYFGLLGIDAMRYRTPDGQVGLRPLQDVNARWTMGRLSLGLRRFLRPGETGTWHHVRWRGDSPAAIRREFDLFLATLPAGARVLRTSPFEVAERPNPLGSVAVMGP